MKFIMSVSFSISVWPAAVGWTRRGGGLGFRNTNYFADLVSILSGGPRPRQVLNVSMIRDSVQVEFCLQYWKEWWLISTDLFSVAIYVG